MFGVLRSCLVYIMVYIRNSVGLAIMDVIGAKRVGKDEFFYFSFGFVVLIFFVKDIV